jgi:transcriptional regulator with XRE-family HTH domain
MKLHEKIKRFREIKQWSQENVAFELGLNQSQYSRRESGMIKFNSEEIVFLAKIFEIPISELFDEYDGSLKKNSPSSEEFNYYFARTEGLIQQYELRLQEKDELIMELREKLSLIKKSKIQK